MKWPSQRVSIPDHDICELTPQHEGVWQRTIEDEQVRKLKNPWVFRRHYFANLAVGSTRRQIVTTMLGLTVSAVAVWGLPDASDKETPSPGSVTGTAPAEVPRPGASLLPRAPEVFPDDGSVQNHGTWSRELPGVVVTNHAEDNAGTTVVQTPPARVFMGPTITSSSTPVPLSPTRY